MTGAAVVAGGGPAERIGRALLLAVLLFAGYVALQVATGWSVARLPFGWRGVAAGGAFPLDAGLMVLAWRWLSPRIERRPAAAFSFVPGAIMGRGILLGAGLLGATAAVAFAAGAGRVEGWGDAARVVPAFCASVFAAVGEEIVFRGVLFRALRDALGLGPGLALSALLFGGLHALNPGATLPGVAAIALEAGVMLGLAFERTHDLRFPIGVHLGWNFVEGGILGGGVSGTHDAGLLATAMSGPPLLTGGAFGLEASVQAVVLCGIASAVLWRGVVARDRRFVPG
ncbi:MAG: CPBP family intramembrane metalloprotease [Gluconacetobacter diazotrophicus]|nr:CPBP family intramembrane metalloprotease [Gluconacetobacter diazotrophicus]